MEHPGAFTTSVLLQWRRRENVVPGLALVALALGAWAYVFYQAASMRDMSMGDTGVVPVGGMGATGGAAPFLLAWTVMMVAMMVPATLPLILLYRVTARNLWGTLRARTGTAALLAGYMAVWAAAGVPVSAYGLSAAGAGSLAAVLPALLLMVGGAYQFTPLKRHCHVRCSAPLVFLMQNWRPGTAGAARLGVSHGVDCLGCCAGVMAALVALGMMNLAWMLTAAVVIFAEKTFPGSHRIARPLGVLMVVGGVLVLGMPLFDAAVSAGSM